MLQPADFLCPELGSAEAALVVEDFNLEQIEKLVIRKALVKHGGNVTHATEELGLTRMPLYRRMERYGL